VSLGLALRHLCNCSSRALVTPVHLASTCITAIHCVQNKNQRTKIHFRSIARACLPGSMPQERHVLKNMVQPAGFHKQDLQVSRAIPKGLCNNSAIDYATFRRPQGLAWLTQSHCFFQWSGIEIMPHGRSNTIAQHLQLKHPQGTVSTSL
jgi:hypothetical protein